MPAAEKESAHQEAKVRGVEQEGMGGGPLVHTAPHGIRFKLDMRHGMAFQYLVQPGVSVEGLRGGAGRAQ
jgi:hypothetical protein